MTIRDAGNMFDGLSARQRLILRWAALGALSGLCATLSIFMFEWIGLYREQTLKFDLPGPMFGPIEISISPLSLGPGLVFGLIAGFALHRRGLAGGWRYPVYAVAAMLSYFAAVQLALGYLVDRVDNVVVVGMIAGLFGAGLLTAASAALVPQFRRVRPCLAMIAAGTVFGALLFTPIDGGGFFSWLALFAPWQAGYAAAMATAFDNR